MGCLGSSWVPLGSLRFPWVLLPFSSSALLCAPLRSSALLCELCASALSLISFFAFLFSSSRTLNCKLSPSFFDQKGSPSLPTARRQSPVHPSGRDPTLILPLSPVVTPASLLRTLLISAIKSSSSCIWLSLLAFGCPRHGVCARVLGLSRVSLLCELCALRALCVIFSFSGLFQLSTFNFQPLPRFSSPGAPEALFYPGLGSLSGFSSLRTPCSPRPLRNLFFSGLFQLLTFNLQPLSPFSSPGAPGSLFYLGLGVASSRLSNPQ